MTDFSNYGLIIRRNGVGDFYFKFVAHLSLALFNVKGHAGFFFVLNIFFMVYLKTGDSTCHKRFPFSAVTYYHYFIQCLCIFLKGNIHNISLYISGLSLKANI